jgi:hypothetical protein
VGFKLETVRRAGSSCLLRSDLVSPFPVFNFVPDMSKAREATKNFIELVDATPSIDAANSGGKAFDVCDGRVQFNDVHF